MSSWEERMAARAKERNPPPPAEAAEWERVGDWTTRVEHDRPLVDALIDAQYEKLAAEVGAEELAQPLPPIACACIGAVVGRNLAGMPCNCKLNAILHERAVRELRSV